MGKHIIFLMLVSLFCFSSCGDDDDNGDKGTIGSVSNASSTSFVGSVILNWTNPSDANLYYVLVSYHDAAGNLINKKVDKYSVNDSGQAETLIGGFSDTNEYQFTLTAYNYTGGSSSSVTVSGSPLSKGEAMNYVIGTVSVEKGVSSATVSWTNETGVAVNLVATYLDRKGTPQSATFDATYTGHKAISGLNGETVISIYAENVEDGAKSDTKQFTVVPDEDPDDIIYDDVEYITFAGGMNNMTISQDNPDNPYEYTIYTTGGDPYISCNGLANAVAGRTLVFRYRSTEAFSLELFWCNAGGGAAGGRSTVVNVPANDSEIWETFRYDYTSAMSTHSWAGNAGDFARFDWGSKALVTIHVKNIHFE